MSLSGETYLPASALDEEILTNDANGLDLIRYVGYARTETMDIPKGKLLFAETSCILFRVAVGLASLSATIGNPIPSTSGFLLKMRRAGTNDEDLFDICDRYGTNACPAGTTKSRQTKAEYSYDQLRLGLFIEPDPPATYQYTLCNDFYVRYLAVDFTVADYVELSQ